MLSHAAPQLLLLLPLLLLLLATCAAQNAPSPSPETPKNRYLETMSSSARALQKKQPLYDFKARAVTGNGMLTILQSKSSALSCLPSGDGDVCSVVQGLIVMPVVCIVIGFLTLLAWCSFIVARKYCKCCCNNCGSRKPQPEGGKYSNRSKIIIAALLFSSSCVIIAIASMAISAAYDAPGAVDRFFNTILDFLDQATSFLNSGNSFILNSGDTLQTTVIGVQSSFFALQNTLNNSQISASAQLHSMNAVLHVIEAACTNFSTSTACGIKVLAFRYSVSSSIASLNRFEIKSLALSDVGSEISSKLAKNTESTRDAILQGAKFASSTRKSVLTFQIESQGPQGRAQLGTLLLFGSMFLIPVFLVFGFMCHKWTHWFAPGSAARK
jgi:hypothetical protein